MKRIPTRGSDVLADGDTGSTEDTVTAELVAELIKRIIGSDVEEEHLGVQGKVFNADPFTRHHLLSSWRMFIIHRGTRTQPSHRQRKMMNPRSRAAAPDWQDAPKDEHAPATIEGPVMNMPGPSSRRISHLNFPPRPTCR